MKPKTQGKSEHGLPHDCPIQLINKYQAACILNVSPSTLKKYRRDPDGLREGVHFIRVNSRCVKYVEFLIRDWAIHRNNPQVHQQAIEVFLQQMEQYRSPKRRSRRSKSRRNIPNETP